MNGSSPVHKSFELKPGVIPRLDGFLILDVIRVYVYNAFCPSELLRIVANCSELMWIAVNCCEFERVPGLNSVELMSKSVTPCTIHS